MDDLKQFVIWLLILFCTNSVSASEERNVNVSHKEHAGVALASWNIEYVSPMLQIATFVLVAGLLKIAFHHIPHLSSLIPESCILIIIGTAVGAFLYYGGISDSFRMETKTFLLFLLPPIVLEASFTLNDKSFRDHIGTILLYAIVGTVINFLIIGFSMHGLSRTGIMGSVEINQLEYLLFGALIVAVDPVAVLAIFQDIGVNQVLYFLVFGESLLNDAVTIVLYHMMEAFTFTPKIDYTQILIGIGSFFTVSLGGLLIGILFGVVACLLTRVTSHVRVAEPLTIFVMAYMSYLCAELFHWSGIISMIGCGIIEAHYAFKNISRKSYITVLYFIKMLSSCNDSIVFLFLGLELIRTAHVWNTGFICSALVLCLVARIISVFGLTFLVNIFNENKIKMADQFIMWYGGLRGAVCFALCNSLEIESHKKNLFLTTTFVVILFTVFVQGITVKPLVKFCKIVRKDESAVTLMAELQSLMFENMRSALNSIVDQKHLKNKCFSLDDRYVKKLLLKKTLSSQEEFIEAYKEIALKRYKSVLGHLSQVEVTSPKGLDKYLCNDIFRYVSEGFYPIDEDICNQEEDLANEVEQELKTFNEHGIHAGVISRNEIVNLYRAMSKRSLGDTYVFDRDLKYHDIPEEQDDDVEREFKKSMCEIQPIVDGRSRKFSVPVMNRKFSHAVEPSFIGYPLDVQLKGAMSMPFDPSYSTEKKNIRTRYSAFQLPSGYTPHLCTGDFYSQPNSPSRRQQHRYRQKRFSRASPHDVSLAPLGELPEESSTRIKIELIPPSNGGRRATSVGDIQVERIRGPSESSDENVHVSYAGIKSQNREDGLNDETSF